MSDDNLRERVDKAVARSVDYLYERQRADGAWTDRLSSSAVPTSVAVLALARADRNTYSQEIKIGLDWLRRNQREDGGWSLADATPPSDMSVTAFALAALKVLDPEGAKESIAGGMDFIAANGGEEALFPNIRTWRELVSIVWAMEGLRDISDQPVQPIEVMLLPQRLRNRASIALPGVIALGIGQSRMLPSNRLRKLTQRIAEPKGLAWLRAVMAENGGIEECPLMAALVFSGLRIAGKDVGADIQDGCLRYLVETQRPDGSWPIDRDLEIAVTAYSVLALAELGDVSQDPRLQKTRDWLLAAQWQEEFKPLKLPAGGWSWANPSGWPESEDTAVVLSALSLLGVPRESPAVQAGLDWLLTRQNGNGSWSEWVRDSSMIHDGPCPGVTSHVVMALHQCATAEQSAMTIARALDYFTDSKDASGGHSSLWFRDSTHGTAKVLETYAEIGRADETTPAQAATWLLANQREDGSWPAAIVEGDPRGGTAEETAWAVYSLLRAGHAPYDPQIMRGVEWLVQNQNSEGTWRPSVVGLYYDTFYYSDDLIAHTYTLRALARWLKSVELLPH